MEERWAGGGGGYRRGVRTPEGWEAGHLVGRIMVCTLIQEWMEETPSRRLLVAGVMFRAAISPVSWETGLPGASLGLRGRHLLHAGLGRHRGGWILQQGPVSVRSTNCDHPPSTQQVLYTFLQSTALTLDC